MISMLLFGAASISFGQGNLMNKAKNMSTKEAKSADSPVKEAKPGDSKSTHVSEFHKTHEGQIVFNKSTTPDIKSDPEMVSDFNNKDDITGMVYLKPIKSFSRKYKIKMFIDGTEAGTAMDQLTDYTNAFYIRVLRKNGSTECNDFVNKVLKLSPGDHQVKVEIWGSEDGQSNDKEMIAKGEFKLNKIEYIEPSTGKFSAVKAGMTNPDIEQQALKLVNEKATKEGWKERYSKAKIISTAWDIRKNQYTSEIISRHISVLLYGVWPDGKCKSVDFGFYQDYAGGGNYTKNLLYGGIGVMNRVDCE